MKGNNTGLVKLILLVCNHSFGQCVAKITKIQITIVPTGKKNFVLPVTLTPSFYKSSSLCNWDVGKKTLTECKFDSLGLHLSSEPALIYFPNMWSVLCKIIIISIFL